MVAIPPAGLIWRESWHDRTAGATDGAEPKRKTPAPGGVVEGLSLEEFEWLRLEKLMKRDYRRSGYRIVAGG
ncbi:hypothetical protein K678_07308 [Magnetospirillum fulvum MGU-K5]|uniref:Uncharacterized protein n=1 Tax=Magnetospirillum fulvum MGU-K5 TaxID=1316936 RepID=S9S8G0_MAGFU|nr:hypothetical protein K678_07308 [Magnetospirillum fulvum MGU-K5]